MLALTINGTTEYLHPDEANQAMLRYWNAKQAGDNTARLVKVDQSHLTLVPTEDDDDPPPAGSSAALVPETPAEVVTPGTVSEVARLRIAAQDRWLRQAGFHLAPPLFAPGTRVVALGDDNFRIERERVERLPLFPDAAERVCQQIQFEARADHTVPLAGLVMDEAGRLHWGGNPVGLEEVAFDQLAGLGGFGCGLRYLKERCDARLRADNVNHQLPKVKAVRQVVLRTRAAADLADDVDRQVYAVVTPTYAAVDTDVVLRAISEPLRDAHTELRYDGSGIRATALWMPDEVVDLAAGDVFKVGVRVETDDTGRGRIRISGVAFRNRCLNLIIIDEGEVETVAAVHRGDPQRILGLVREGVAKARHSVGNFLEAWGHARTIRVDPTDTIRSWVESKKVQVRSRQDNDQVVEALLSAWHKEPGETLADCVNAVTRAAHENPLWGVDIREELERQASRLVLVPR